MIRFKNGAAVFEDADLWSSGNSFGLRSFLLFRRFGEFAGDLLLFLFLAVGTARDRPRLSLDEFSCSFVEYSSVGTRYISGIGVMV